MRKTLIASLLSGGGTLTLWFSRGTVESWFFDKVLKVIEPYPTWSWAIEYGPPAVFAALTIWLLWRAHRRVPPAPDLNAEAELAKQRRLQDKQDLRREDLKQRAEANRAALSQGGGFIGRTLRLKGGPIRVTPQQVRAMRIGQQVADTGEAIARAFETADKKLRQREELQNEAHHAAGYDPNSEETRNATVLFLAHLREEGVELRDAAADVVNSTLDGWISEIDEWMHAVIDGLALIDKADAVLFRTLDTVPNARVNVNIKVLDPERINDFIRQYRMHDLRLSRLWDLLQKYQGVNFKRG